jgi:hypothetical protein
MTDEYRELYFFLNDEFDNLDNLRDVLKGLGDQKETETSLRQLMDCYVSNSNLEYSEVIQRDEYRLGEESEAAIFETDQGLFVVSNSNYLDRNSRSIPSRSTKSIVRQV